MTTDNIFINDKCLETLEYNKIIEILITKASSNAGRELCKKLLPSSDKKVIDKSIEETDAALSYLWKSGSISFSGLKDVTKSVLLLEKGGSLNAGELLDISSLLYTTKGVCEYFSNEDGIIDNEGPLKTYTENLNPLNSIKREIDRCIISEDEIADDASSTLKSIRRHIHTTGDKIHSTLSGIIKKDAANGYLQDNIITMRSNRYCVPVKAEHKKNVPGMIHDQSSKGSTLFVEPMEVVKLNNELSELYSKEQEEIAAILQSLSNMVATSSREILNDYNALKYLDFVFAKAKFAKDSKCSKPIFNDKRYINLKQARHPLLNKDKVVPVDVHIGDDFNLLIITGPNTGGKTVTLKTVGLLSLMGQAGLFIPADEGSNLGVFHHFFADIGDEQSIEQSLSTFSAHMTNIVKILESADSDSLVLFDELCSGTDPTEGAALGISILNFLHNLDVRTLATTHYSELKLYALETEGVCNGSCEFDVATLSPTYKLLIGVPGKSNAFAISKKLGLPDFIIDDAKSKISESNIAFEDILDELNKNRVEIEKARAEITENRTQTDNIKAEYEKKLKALEERKEKEIAKAKEEANKIIEEAKAYADSTIKELKRDASVGDTKNMDRTRNKLNEHLKKNKTKSSIAKSKQSKTYKASDFHIGDKVKVLTMGADGIVSSLPNPKGDLYVQMGILRSLINIRDLEIVDEPDIIGAPIKYNKSGSGKIKMSKALSVSSEINLLGKTVDEAIGLLDKYLDDAYLAHLASVRVVHGKGTGALRTGITNYLKKSSYVKKFHRGLPEEGGDGVTIVEFK